MINPVWVLSYTQHHSAEIYFSLMVFVDTWFSWCRVNQIPRLYCGLGGGSNARKRRGKLNVYLHLELDASLTARSLHDIGKFK